MLRLMVIVKIEKLAEIIDANASMTFNHTFSAVLARAKNSLKE
ncbi:hypothetical protein ACSLGG_12150 [Bacillus mycoides]